MITRREAKEIIDFVIAEIMKRRFPYVTDGKLDLSKSPVGVVSGTPSIGGSIADGAIWDRHVHPNADIRGTKVRIATTAERGTVELAEHYETTSGIAVQSDDPRLHDVMPSGSAEHDVRYYTEAEISAITSGLGASLVGIYDWEGQFVGEDVEAALHELYLLVTGKTFIQLPDTPDSYSNKYKQVPTVDEGEVGLEWRPVDYYDGGDIGETYSGVLPVNRCEVDGNSATMNDVLDGGDCFSTRRYITDIILIDHDWSGVTSSGIAGETLAFGHLIYYASDNKWYKAVATDETKAGSQLAIAIIGGDADGLIETLLIGYIRDDSWSFPVASGLYIATTSGAMTDVMPTNTGEFVRIVGYMRQNVVWFNPEASFVELT